MRAQELENERASLQKKLARVEKKLESSSRDMADRHDAEVAELRGSLAREQSRVGELSQELSQTINSYEGRQESMRSELEGLRELPPMLERGDFLTAVDLTDGYFHLSVREGDRRYMTFHLAGFGYFRYVAMPFGDQSKPFQCPVLLLQTNLFVNPEMLITQTRIPLQTQR